MRSFWNLTAFWIALTVVLGHSVLPVGSPLYSAAGSAFSASTFDVALGPSQRGDRQDKPSTIAAAGDGGRPSFVSSPAALVGIAIFAKPCLRAVALFGPRHATIAYNRAAHAYHSRAPPLF